LSPLCFGKSGSILPLKTYAWFKRELLSDGKGKMCMLFRVVPREVKLFKGRGPK
jgi:hypothetical protein